MLERLRQVAFLVKDLEDAKALYRRYLGMETCHSEDLSRYGLRNAVLPAGNGTFIELLQPTTGDSSAARYLERRGEAPYMLIFETRDYDRLIPHLKSMGIRLAEEPSENDYRHAFVHPSSANGAFLEIIEVAGGTNPWPAAGPHWQSLERRPMTKQLRQMAVLVRDLDQAVAQWEKMFGITATKRFHVSFTDLEIAVLPLSGPLSSENTFIELAQPTGGDVPSARFLERYGEGIYLTIYEIDDSLSMDDYLKGQEARYTSSRVTSNYVNLGFNSIWLHPAGMKGAFTQLSQVLVNDNPWPPAGDTWHLE